MSFISLGVHVILLVISYVIYKKISNPFVFFNLIWSVLIGISIIGTSGINKPSSDVYFIFLLGGLSFNIFGGIFMLLDQFMHSNNKLYNKKIYINDVWKRIAFSILNIIIFCYYVYKGFELLSSLTSGGSYENIRGYYYSDDYFTTTFEYLIVTYVFDPLITVAEIVFAINLLDRKYNKYAMGIMLANIVLRALISGGRMIVFEFGVIILICFILNRKVIKDSKKVRVQMFVVFAAAIIIAGSISIGRSQGSSVGFLQGVFGALASNFTGSFTYFSVLERLNNFSSDSFISVVFAGLLDMIAMVLNFVGITDIDLVRNNIGTILAKFYLIGDLSYNAMPTMYYYFYGSLGKIGVLLGSAILAFYCTFAYKRNKRYRTYKSFAFYLLMMLVIMETPMKWLPFDSSFIMTMFYIVVFISNKKMDIKVPMEKKR